MKFSSKLSLSIFMVGIAVLSLSSYTLHKFNYKSFLKMQSRHAQLLANEVSDDIDYLLLEKVKVALTLANTPTIKAVLEASNRSYDDLSDAKRKKTVKFQNEKWKSTKDPDDNFLLQFTDNKTSRFLKKQQVILDGEYGEIFLTNKRGDLVASTSKLSTFSHGHKYWWLGAYDKGHGAIFFDDRGYDDSVGGYVLGLVVPVKNGTEVIGILKCNLNILGSINKLISGVEDELLGEIKLVRSGGIIVFEEGHEPLSTQVHGDIYKKIKNRNNEPSIIDDAGKKYLVGFSHVKLTSGKNGYGFGGTFKSPDHKKGNTGESWYVLCYQQMSLLEAPVNNSIKRIFIIGVIIISILALVSYLFGRKISQPLIKLDKATQKIGEGNFEYRVDIRQTDEIGNLASSFNSMADSLQNNTTSIELLENEIVVRKKAEASLKKSDKEMKKIISELETALSHVKTLSGLLPICSHCKKIRDDKGYWNSIENYIHDHSDAEFSHSICNDCMEKYYPKE